MKDKTHAIHNTTRYALKMRIVYGTEPQIYKKKHARKEMKEKQHRDDDVLVHRVCVQASPTLIHAAAAAVSLCVIVVVVVAVVVIVAAAVVVVRNADSVRIAFRAMYSISPEYIGAMRRMFTLYTMYIHNSIFPSFV